QRRLLIFSLKTQRGLVCDQENKYACETYFTTIYIA
ncbi:MAG: hypothetical protein ACJAT7_002850, partial [Psychromonas sp.]